MRAVAGWAKLSYGPVKARTNLAYYYLECDIFNGQDTRLAFVVNFWSSLYHVFVEFKLFLPKDSFFLFEKSPDCVPLFLQLNLLSLCSEINIKNDEVPGDPTKREPPIYVIT